MTDCKFVINVEQNASIITEVIDSLIKEASNNVLTNQLKTYSGDFPGSTYADMNSIT
jgi:hypothetical protein